MAPTCYTMKNLHYRTASLPESVHQYHHLLDSRVHRLVVLVLVVLMMLVLLVLVVLVLVVLVVMNQIAEL